MKQTVQPDEFVILHLSKHNRQYHNSDFLSTLQVISRAKLYRKKQIGQQMLIELARDLFIRYVRNWYFTILNLNCSFNKKNNWQPIMEAKEWRRCLNS